MKYLVVIFGLIATSWATQPATQTCLNKISDCFSQAGLISLPDIVLQANISMYTLGITISVDLDCAIIAALVDIGSELSYTESTSNGVVTAQISIGVLLNANFSLNASVNITILGLIQIASGTCVITFIDSSIIFNISATFIEFDAINCSINEAELVFTKSGCTISGSGNTNVDTITTSYKDYICEETFNNTKDAIQGVLNVCVDL